jgi:hypothetical protein
MSSNDDNLTQNEPILYDINEYVTWINEIDLNKVNKVNQNRWLERKVILDCISNYFEGPNPVDKV